MKQKYTTGELAKMCNVSVRTIQYYDIQDILKPYEISEGGRRVYTDEELRKLRCICLYKSLGFSLDEINSIAGEEDTFGILSEIIVSQQKKIKDDILILQEKEQKLSEISEQIKETGAPKVESIDELNWIIAKKRQHRKTDIMTYILIGSYLIILGLAFPIAMSTGGVIALIIPITLVVLLLALVYYHSQVNAFICDNCNNKITLGFIKDLLSFNRGKKGKYLKCPKCDHKGWFKETFPD